MLWIMKSEMILSGQKTEYQFPLLARSTAPAESEQFCVLFTSEKKGTVIHRGVSAIYSRMGYFCEGWISCFDTSYWEVLPPGSTITLTQ